MSVFSVNQYSSVSPTAGKSGEIPAIVHHLSLPQFLSASSGNYDKKTGIPWNSGFVKHFEPPKRIRLTLAEFPYLFGDCQALPKTLVKTEM
ncbi:MAG: hypothetical protein II774_02120, partial [Lachnospiraceae bacterium]|nr:hypothetical protein [Lachnospiraceae bacterium]